MVWRLNPANKMQCGTRWNLFLSMFFFMSFTHDFGIIFRTVLSQSNIALTNIILSKLNQITIFPPYFSRSCDVRVLSIKFWHILNEIFEVHVNLYRFFFRIFSDVIEYCTIDEIVQYFKFDIVCLTICAQLMNDTYIIHQFLFWLG